MDEKQGKNERKPHLLVYTKNGEISCVYASLTTQYQHLIDKSIRKTRFLLQSPV